MDGHLCLGFHYNSIEVTGSITNNKIISRTITNNKMMSRNITNAFVRDGGLAGRG